MKRLLFSLLLLSLVTAAQAAPVQDDPSPWPALVDRLAQEGINRGYLSVLFARDLVQYTPAVMARKMDALTETMLRRRQGEQKPVPHEERAELYDQYTNPDLMRTAREYMHSRARLFASIEREYGVPREVMVALLQVETKLCTQVGKIRVFVNLASMAASTETDMFRHAMTKTVPSDTKAREWFARRTRDKADWAFKELAALIRYARANRQDPLNVMGSVYGAIGYCQFMPTNAETLGRDGDGDGVVNLFHEADAIASMANYLHHHGWKGTMTPEKRYKAIYAYNHSKHYTEAILAVAEKLARAR